MARRILYVSAVSALGGAEQSLLQLVRALDRSRFEPLAAVPEGPLADELRDAGVGVFCIPAMRLRRTICPVELIAAGARLKFTAMRLVEFIRARDVALVHSNTTTAQLVAAPAAALAHVPTLWHVRDLRTPACARHVLRMLRPEVVCISRAVRDALGIAAHVIPNGIDADAFARAAQPGRLRAELGLGAGTRLIVMAAQMVPWKGHATLIRALDILKETQGDFVAAIAGADMFGEHSDYVALLRAQAEELELEDNVRFIGQRRDVATLMADADVVAVPSDAEPFGRVALEAMAVGKPVVGTAAGGLPEVVADGETGILVPARDPRSLAAALGGLIADAALARRMGECGGQRVREQFSAERHARAVADLYERMLAGP